MESMILRIGQLPAVGTVASPGPVADVVFAVTSDAEWAFPRRVPGRGASGE
jgi:hypothetical protein